MCASWRNNSIRNEFHKNFSELFSSIIYFSFFHCANIPSKDSAVETVKTRVTRNIKTSNFPLLFAMMMSHMRKTIKKIFADDFIILNDKVHVCVRQNDTGANNTIPYRKIRGTPISIKLLKEFESESANIKSKQARRVTRSLSRLFKTGCFTPLYLM